jgi:sarcosine oxidase
MAATQHYDVIVAGIGAMGSAACYHLARRGLRVLGLEKHDIPHTMGSSHGTNRIIRLAYYEDPSYVPLLRRAYELWRELESGFGEQLLYITGSIDADDRDGAIFTESLRSCHIHDIEHEVLTSAQLTARFPGYRLPTNHMALYQPDGGFVMSERAIVAHVLGAIEAGAEIRAQEEMLAWELTASGVRVETRRGVVEAERLVISTGAWIGKHVDGFAALAQPERQVLAWLQPLEPALFTPDVFPVFNLNTVEGRYYGFPVYGVPGFKIGRYHHLDEQVDPDAIDRAGRDDDEAVLRDFTATYFPAANGSLMALRTCMFTNTPDEHFIVDTLPDEPRVVVASPCSGHGYKFAAVIGEILADLATTAATRHDISLFRLNRFATQDAR